MGTSMAVIIPTVSSSGTLDLVVESVMSQTLPPDILIIQNGRQMADQCSRWEAQGVSVHRPGYNMGCSRSWNHGLRWAWERGHDKAFLINDDLILEDATTFETIEEAFADYPNAHYHLCGFSAVAISKTNHQLVGDFDEGFYPAYFEDNDYYMRSILSGIEWRGVVKSFRHQRSSSMLDKKIRNLIARTFPMNESRYLKKWGGPPHQETYTVPWNGGPPQPGTKELLEAEGWTDWYP